jgi:hypothetical protein
MICISSKGLCGGNDFRYPFLKEDRLTARKTEGNGSKRVDMLWITKSSQSLLKSALIPELFYSRLPMQDEVIFWPSEGTKAFGDLHWSALTMFHPLRTLPLLLRRVLGPLVGPNCSGKSALNGA